MIIFGENAVDESIIDRIEFREDGSCDLYLKEPYARQREWVKRNPDFEAVSFAQIESDMSGIDVALEPIHVIADQSTALRDWHDRKAHARV